MIKLNVIIRITDKEIFSSVFFILMFITNVNDATVIPYCIDMIIEHEDYVTNIMSL